MYNLQSKVVHPGLTQVVLAEPLAEKSKWEAIERISLMAVVYTTSLSHLDPIGNSMWGEFNFVNPETSFWCTVRTLMSRIQHFMLDLDLSSKPIFP